MKVLAGFASGQTIVTLPTACRPQAGSTQSVAGHDLTNNGTVWFTVGSGGNFTFQGSSAAVVAADIIGFQGRIYLNAGQETVTSMLDVASR